MSTKSIKEDIEDRGMIVFDTSGEWERFVESMAFGRMDVPHKPLAFPCVGVMTVTSYQQQEDELHFYYQHDFLWLTQNTARKPDVINAVVSTLEIG